jgi:porin
VGGLVVRAYRYRGRVRAVATAAFAFVAAPSIASEEPPATETVQVSLQYTGDGFGNTEGGTARGVRYLQKAEVLLEASGSVAGINDLNAFLDLGYLNGVGFSRTLVGDTQGVDNIESYRGFDVFQAWVSKSFPSQSMKVTVGLIDLNANQFDTQNVGAHFLNSSHGVGAELSHSGRAGPSIFPLVSLGGIVEKTIDTTPNGGTLTLRLGVFDGVPGNPDSPDRFAVRLGARDGLLLVGQAEQSLGSESSLQLGYWQYTASREFTLPIDGAARAAAGERGGYVRIEGPVAHLKGNSTLSGWARAGVANARFGSISNYFGGGLVASGIFLGGGGDYLGIAIASAGFSNRFRASIDAPARSSARETTFELTYQTPEWRGLTLQPDLQFVLHPGGDRAVPGALVIGLRLAFKRPFFAASGTSGKR